MTDNAELIAEARDIWEADDLYPDQMIPRLVKALEAADQRADLAEADREPSDAEVEAAKAVLDSVEYADEPQAIRAALIAAQEVRNEAP